MLERQYFVILHTMKRALNILLATVLILLTCCCNPHETEKQKHLFLVYIAATDQVIHNFAQGNVTDMLDGYVPAKQSSDDVLLVFYQGIDYNTATKRADAALTRYYKNNSGNMVSEIVASFDSDFNACDPASFAEVLEIAEDYCSPTYRSLLFSSHGTAWLPIGYFSSPTDKSFSLSQMRKGPEDSGISSLSKLNSIESIGRDKPTGDELDIIDFARVTGKYHWNVMLLDCCLMSAVEVAYELRDCCDWIMASPTEILAYGFVYNNITEKVFKSPNEAGYRFLCQQYYDFYQAGTGSLQSGTIALIKCSELEALSDICAEIAATRRSQMESVERMKVQHYFYNSHYDYNFDLADYFRQFATEDQYNRFCTQLERAVPYKATTNEFLGLKIEHYSGLSCYIPDSRYVNLNDYYKQLAWNQKVVVVE